MNWLKTSFKWFLRLFILLRLLISLSVLLFLAFIIVWGIGTWYRQQTVNQPLSWGVVWSSKQAQAAELNNQDLDRLLSEIPFKRLQLSSEWDLNQPALKTYNWSQLQEQIKYAKARNLRISLQIGLHQSQWPYCHQPDWSKGFKKKELLLHLEKYIKQLIETVDHHVNIVEYQLEPEIFQADKSCSHILNQEDLFNLYHVLDEISDKDIAVSHDAQWPIWKSNQIEPAALGLELSSQKESLQWIPGHYYSFLAGTGKLFNSESRVFIRKLSLEPQVKTSKSWKKNSLPAEEIKKRMEYARKTQIKTIDLTGASWWLWQSKQGYNQFMEVVAERVRKDF